MSHVVYHMHYPYETDTMLGYIGVTGDLSKRKWKHRNDPVNHLTAEAVSNGVVFTVIYRGTEKECLDIEKVLRPDTNIGWNIRTGGDNYIQSQDSKDKMSEKKLGNKNVGSGESHHFTGKSGKDAVRFGTRGEKSPMHKGFWITPSGSFASKSLAAESCNVSMSTVDYRCKHKTNFKEWYFEDSKNEN